jgi:hypothetical protein
MSFADYLDSIGAQQVGIYNTNQLLPQAERNEFGSYGARSPNISYGDNVPKANGRTGVERQYYYEDGHDKNTEGLYEPYDAGNWNTQSAYLDKNRNFLGYGDKEGLLSNPQMMADYTAYQVNEPIRQAQQQQAQAVAQQQQLALQQARADRRQNVAPSVSSIPQGGLIQQAQQAAPQVQQAVQQAAPQLGQLHRGGGQQAPQGLLGGLHRGSAS